MAIERNPPAQFNAGVALAVPSQCRVDTSKLVAAVGGLLHRHEALHTRILDIDGEPRQVVEPAGVADVEVVEAADEDVPRLVHRLRARPFDYSRGDLPVRIMLTGRHNAVRYVLLSICHIAADLFALHIVCRDLLTLLAGDPVPAPGLQPVDLARQQRTLAGQRRTASAVDYWSTQLRQLKEPMFANIRPSGPPRFRSARLVSPAVAAAARLLADQHGVGDGIVLQHACVTLLRRLTGRRTCYLKVFTNNRFRPQHDEIVSTVSQLGLFVSELDQETPFAEALRHTDRAAVLSHRHAYYDQYKLDSAIDGLHRQLDSKVRLDCYFNDARSDGPQIWTGTSHPTFDPVPESTVDATDGAAIRKATALTSFGWLEDPEWMRCNFSMRIFGTPAAPQISLSANTQYLTDQQMEKFLRDFEDLLVAAVA